ncbi:MAG: hypothetical protein QOK11_1869 [Pseudonocardiales bacterium]|nr:hypothetical protein [Pseudonocardiales bacterium]
MPVPTTCREHGSALGMWHPAELSRGGLWAISAASSLVAGIAQTNRCFGCVLASALISLGEEADLWACWVVRSSIEMPRLAPTAASTPTKTARANDPRESDGLDVFVITPDCDDALWAGCAVAL